MHLIPTPPQRKALQSSPSRVAILVNLSAKSAGGDGTLNCVLHAILQVFDDGVDVPYLGAIGLGSRNNYHKPFRNTCRGIPIRIDLASPEMSSVGQVLYDSGRESPFAISSREQAWG